MLRREHGNFVNLFHSTSLSQHEVTPAQLKPLVLGQGDAQQRSSNHHHHHQPWTWALPCCPLMVQGLAFPNKEQKQATLSTFIVQPTAHMNHTSRETDLAMAVPVRAKLLYKYLKWIYNNPITIVPQASQQYVWGFTTLNGYKNLHHALVKTFLSSRCFHNLKFILLNTICTDTKTLKHKAWIL